MGQYESSHQIDDINFNSRKNCRTNMSSNQKKNSSFTKDQIVNNEIDDSIVKKAFPSRRFSRKSSKAHSLRLKYFKSSEYNLSRGSNDVELIVRKKLITTTTTTTMNNDLNNSISNVSTNIEKSVKSENDSDTENKIIMQRVVNNANPENTADAVHALSQNSKNNLDNVFNQSNYSIQTNSNVASETAEKRVSTFKKEQLEYEFRIKPKSNTKKKRKNKNDILASASHLNSGEHYDSVYYRHIICCGIKCCDIPYNNENSQYQNTFDDDTIQKHSDVSTTRAPFTIKSDESTSLDEQSNVCCFNLKINTKYIQIFGRKFYFDKNNHDVSTDDISQLRKINKKERLFSRKSVSSVSGVKSRHLYSDTRRGDENSDDDNLNSDQPPITCIRVLRPSNDLTPVRFDSHYNIIQAENSENTSLICNAEISLTESISSENNTSGIIQYVDDCHSEKN